MSGENTSLKTFIVFKTAYNRSGYLNKNGEGLITIEASNSNERKQFSTRIHVKPENFKDGTIIGIENSMEFNYRISTLISEFYSLESKFMYENRRYPSLDEFSSLIKDNQTEKIPLNEFCDIVMKESDRKDSTINGYNTLMNDIEEFHKKK